MGLVDSICSYPVLPLFHLSQAKCFKQAKLGHLWLFLIFLFQIRKSTENNTMDAHSFCLLLSPSV